MSAREPWQLSRAEWDEERSRLRPDYAQSNYTSKSGSEAVARQKRLDWLLFDVRKDDSALMRAARNGEVTLSHEDAEDLLDRLQQPVTHADVIARALRLGLLEAAPESMAA